MNKFKIIIVLLMLSFLTGVSFSEDDIKINLYGKDIELNIKPYIDSNNRTMIPVRVVSEALGAEVTWNSKSEEVIIVSKDKTIVLKIDDNLMLINGEKVQMDTSPTIKDSSTFVPIRFISEALDLKIEWREDTSTIVLNEKAEETSDYSLVTNNEIYLDDVKLEDSITELGSVDNEKKSFAIRFKKPVKIEDSQEINMIRTDMKWQVETKLEWLDSNTIVILPVEPYIPDVVYQLIITDKRLKNQSFNEVNKYLINFSYASVQTSEKGDFVESLEKLREDVRKLKDKLPPNTQTTENLYTLLSDSEEALAGTEINQEIYLRYANDKSIVDGYEYLKRIEKEKDYRKELDELSEQVHNWINENPIVEGTPKWEEYQKINGSIFEVNYYSIIVTYNDYNQIKDYFEKLKEM